MQQIGFGHIWRDIVCGLLASSTTQVMLNGSPGEHIAHRRGLRQGDPLSPMLFILVMDVLGLLFSKAEEAGLLQQLSRRKKLHRISIYADDVAMFLHPTAEETSITLDILQLFGDASGLINNAQKSNVYPIQCPERWQPSPAGIWGSPYPCISFLGSSSSPLLKELQINSLIGKLT
jgi:hypothetical protein